MTRTERRFSNFSDADAVVVLHGNTKLHGTLGLEIWAVGVFRSILLATETIAREFVSPDNEYATVNEWQRAFDICDE